MAVFEAEGSSDKNHGGKMPEKYDVVIVGAGTAGLSAISEVRKQTENFLLVNAGPYGTTCARVGCMPSKVLIETANVFHRRKIFNDFGIRGGEKLEMDVPAALSRVRHLRDAFVSGTLKTTDRLGDRSVSGRARFVAPDTLSIDGRKVHARKIVIATGSRPVVPESWRSLKNHIITSDDLFELENLPSSIGVIGLGPNGVEIAQALSRLGIDIEAFDMEGRIAGLSDPAITKSAIAALEVEFPIHIGHSATPEAEGEKVRIRFGSDSFLVDKVIAALGRRPNIDDMGLENLGLDLDDRGLPPFDPTSLQIADLPIFIAGDVNQYQPVLHEASDEGSIAGRNAVAQTPQCYQRRVPLSIVFVDPGMVVVGRRFSNLEEGGYIVGEADFAQQGRAIAAAVNRGLVRVYAEKESSLLVGAEMCAPGAEHMGHLLALAIGQRLGVNELLRMPFYHPVLEEGLRKALRELAAQLSSGPPPDLAGCESFAPGAMD